MQYVDDYAREEQERRRRGLGSTAFLEDRPPLAPETSTSMAAAKPPLPLPQPPQPQQPQQQQPDDDDDSQEEELEERGVEFVTTAQLQQQPRRGPPPPPPPPLGSDFVNGRFAPPPPQQQQQQQGGGQQAVNGPSATGLRRASRSGEGALQKQAPFGHSGSSGLLALRSSYVTSDRVPDFIATDPPEVRHERLPPGAKTALRSRSVNNNNNNGGYGYGYGYGGGAAEKIRSHRDASIGETGTGCRWAAAATGRWRRARSTRASSP